MRLGRAFKGFFSGFSHGSEIERRMQESRKAVARELERAGAAHTRSAPRGTSVALLKDSIKTILIVGAIVLVVLNLPEIYSAADESGWVPHTKVVTVFMHSSEWIAGEYKACSSSANQPPQEIARLDCGGVFNEAHDLSVRFWGPSNTQTERMWNCQRSQSLIDGVTSLTCKLQ